MDWLPIALICAFSLASADAASKAWLQGYSAWELVLVRFSLGGALLAPALWFFPLGGPEPVFWAWIAGLAPLEILAMLLYVKAIRDHPLSLTMPYLAFTPVFVVLTGWLVLGETVDFYGLIGIMLVMAGGWLLNLAHASLQDWRTWFDPLKAILYEPGSRLMLMVAAIYSLTSVMGKSAVQYTTPEAMGAFYYLAIGLLTAIAAALRDPALLRNSVRRPAASFAVAGMTALMVFTHFIAISMVEVAYMISVKRTSLLFGMVFGAIWFREGGLITRLPAGVLMVSGVYLILS